METEEARKEVNEEGDVVDGTEGSEGRNKRKTKKKTYIKKEENV